MPVVKGIRDCRSWDRAPSSERPSLWRPDRAALGTERADLKVAVTLRPVLSGLAKENLADGANFAQHVSDDPDAVAQRRVQLRAELGVRDIQWLSQQHTSRVLLPEALDPAQAPVADAAVGEQPGRALAVLTADCLPVVLWLESAPGLAVVHAGWAGLSNGILPAAVAAVRSRASGAAAADCRAWIGPAVCGAHYEVDQARAVACGADVTDATDAIGSARSLRLAAKRQLCLATLAARELTTLGVSVRLAERCSYGDPALYSHRRAQHLADAPPTTGRFATVAWRSI